MQPKCIWVKERTLAYFYFFQFWWSLWGYQNKQLILLYLQFLYRLETVFYKDRHMVWNFFFKCLIKLLFFLHKSRNTIIITKLLFAHTVYNCNAFSYQHYIHVYSSWHAAHVSYDSLYFYVDVFYSG